MLPCPNVQMEDPLIASRVLFWMTWKFGVSGFEYYCYNIWKYNEPDKSGRRWPEKPFNPRGWGDTNGDGMLFYPGPDGPFSSVRFENIRDGIEDWESHYVLRDCIEAMEKKDKSAPLLAQAKAVLAVPDEVCGLRFDQWTWKPDVLLAARMKLGDTIDSLSKLVTEDEILAVRKARKEDELSRQRDAQAARGGREIGRAIVAAASRRCSEQSRDGSATTGHWRLRLIWRSPRPVPPGSQFPRR